MLFTELRFLVFFIAVFVVYWTIRWRVARVSLLTAASFVFYGAWDYRFLALLSGVVLIAYVGHSLIFHLKKENDKNLVVYVSVTLLLLLLGVFKYFNFFGDSFVSLFQSMGVELSQPTVSIILPVGISFYIFQSIGFIVDVKRREIDEPKSLLSVAFFVVFFPQLVAGPIVRAKDFFPQIPVHQRLRDVPFKGVALLFLGGFFKKAVIADNMGSLYADPVFTDPWNYTKPDLILGVLAYAVQIFCDFSGYSDMAIAVSRAFGFQLPVNFNAPYLSTSITQFWRRWHISLSHWLRDYLYITLGGNRGGEFNTYRNLMATMVLGGLWHGASWNFLFWGYIHGAALAVERLFNWDKITRKSWLLGAFGVVVTLTITCLAWVFFRSSNFDVSLYIISGMFFLAETGSMSFGLLPWVALLALALFHSAIHKYNLGQALIRLPDAVFFAFCGLALACMLPLLPSQSQPFIYFQF